MKWYRLVDAWGEPYHSGYNETNLKELAYAMWSLGDGDGMRDDESFYGKTQEENVGKIYSLLKAGERDLAYFVEECDEPFEAEGDYGGDDCGHNYSAKEITDYLSTREDCKEIINTKEKLQAIREYIWSFSTHNGLKNRHLSEIVDEFTYIDWKDDLFDDLNNILFDKHSEIIDYITKWCAEHSIWIDDIGVGDLASEFIDLKELYDLDYDEE